MTWRVLNDEDAEPKRKLSGDEPKLAKEDLVQICREKYESTLIQPMLDPIETLRELSKDVIIVEELENTEESRVKQLAFAVYFNLGNLLKDLLTKAFEERRTDTKDLVEEARACLMNAVKLSNDLLAVQRLGELLLLCAEFGEAIACFHVVLEGDSKVLRWKALCSLCECMFLAGNEAGCLIYLEQALQWNASYEFGVRLKQWLAMNPEDKYRHELMELKEDYLKRREFLHVHEAPPEENPMEIELEHNCPSCLLVQLHEFVKDKPMEKIMKKVVIKFNQHAEVIDEDPKPEVIDMEESDSEETKTRASNRLKNLESLEIASASKLLQPNSQTEVFMRQLSKVTGENYEVRFGQEEAQKLEKFQGPGKLEKFLLMIRKCYHHSGEYLSSMLKEGRRKRQRNQQKKTPSEQDSQEQWMTCVTDAADHLHGQKPFPFELKSDNVLGLICELGIHLDGKANLLFMECARLLMQEGVFTRSNPVFQLLMICLPEADANEWVVFLFSIVENYLDVIKSLEIVVPGVYKFLNCLLAYCSVSIEINSLDKLLLLRYLYNYSQLCSLQGKEEEVSSLLARFLAETEATGIDTIFTCTREERAVAITRDQVEMECSRTVFNNYIKQLLSEPFTREEFEDLFGHLVEDRNLDSDYPLEKHMMQRLFSHMEIREKLHVLLKIHACIPDDDDKEVPSLFRVLRTVLHEYLVSHYRALQTSAGSEDNQKFLNSIDIVEGVVLALRIVKKLNSISTLQFPTGFGEILTRLLYICTDIFQRHDEISDFILNKTDTFELSFIERSREETPEKLKEYSKLFAELSQLSVEVPILFVRFSHQNIRFEVFHAFINLLAENRLCHLSDAQFLRHALDFVEDVNDGSDKYFKLLITCYNCLYGLCFDVEDGPHINEDTISLESLEFKEVLQVYLKLFPYLERHLWQKDVQAFFSGLFEKFNESVFEMLNKQSLRYNQNVSKLRAFLDRNDLLKYLHAQHETVDLKPVDMTRLAKEYELDPSESPKIVRFFEILVDIEVQQANQSKMSQSTDDSKRSSRIYQLEEAIESIVSLLGFGLYQKEPKFWYKLSFCFNLLLEEILSWHPTIINDRFTDVLHYQRSSVKCLVIALESVGDNTEFRIALLSELGHLLYSLVGKPSLGQCFLREMEENKLVKRLMKDVKAEGSVFVSQEDSIKQLQQEGFFISSQATNLDQAEEEAEEVHNKLDECEVMPISPDLNSIPSAVKRFIYSLVYQCFSRCRKAFKLIKSDKKEPFDWPLMLGKCLEKVSRYDKATFMYIQAMQLSANDGVPMFQMELDTVFSFFSKWRGQFRLQPLEGSRFVSIDAHYKLFSLLCKRATRNDATLQDVAYLYEQITESKEPQMPIILSMLLKIADILTNEDKLFHRVSFRKAWLLNTSRTKFELVKKETYNLFQVKQKFANIYRTEFERIGKFYSYVYDYTMLFMDVIIQAQDWDTMYAVLRRFSNPYFEIFWPQDLWKRGFFAYCYMLYAETCTVLKLPVDKLLVFNQEAVEGLLSQFDAYWLLKGKFSRRIIVRCLQHIEQPLSQTTNENLLELIEMLKKLQDARQKLRDSVSFMEFESPVLVKWSKVQILDRLLCLVYSKLIFFSSYVMMDSKTEGEWDRHMTLFVQFMLERPQQPEFKRMLPEVRFEELPKKLLPFMKTMVKASQAEANDLLDHSTLITKAGTFVRSLKSAKPVQEAENEPKAMDTSE